MCIPESITAASNKHVGYFFINSSTAEVIALIPVRSVGSGTGAKSAE
jgi:hypothetical protein